LVRDYQGSKSEEQLRSKVRCTLIVRLWDSAAEAEIVRREDDATRFGARSPEGFSSRFRGSWRHYLPIFSSMLEEVLWREERDRKQTKPRLCLTIPRNHPVRPRDGFFSFDLGLVQFPSLTSTFSSLPLPSKPFLTSVSILLAP